MTDAVGQSRELLEEFVDEAIAALEGLPDQLTAYAENPNDSSHVHAVFRAVHSIKGNAGFFGFMAVKEFAHTLENTLDDLRNGVAELGEDLLRLLIRGFDFLQELVDATLDGPADAEMTDEQRELLDEVSAVASASMAEGASVEQLAAQLRLLEDELRETDLPQARDWCHRLLKVADSLASPDEGEGEEGPELPSAASFVDAKVTCAGNDASDHVKRVLEVFLAGDRGEYSDAEGAAFIEAANTLAAQASGWGDETLAEALRGGATDLNTIMSSPLDVDATLLGVIWQRVAPELVRLRDAAASDGATADEQAGAEADGPDSGGGDAAPVAKARMVRVKEERIEEFLNNVSSLFITCEMYKDLQARMHNEFNSSALVEELREVNRTFVVQSTDLQHSVVSLSRVPIGGLFSKFSRMARSVASQIDKKVDVEVLGSDVEIDKTLMDDLDAPLTHMVRNVVDHAIEMPEERIARGLSEAGHLTLRAELTRTHVRVFVEDDGRGIDPKKIRSKAVEKGVMTQAQADALSDQEAVELVFHPGFSTVENVSELSGRGVGMDVVRTTIKDHGGEVFVESQVGVGTTFRMEIPLRSAVMVIDGLMVQQAEQNFVVPFDHILEITEVPLEAVNYVGGDLMVDIRGKNHHAVSLGDLLDLPGIVEDAKTVQAVLVGGKFGSLCLLVDQVHGHRQVVVNNIEDVLPDVDGIAGVAQLGGGRLALVVNVPEIVNRLHVTTG